MSFPYLLFTSWGNITSGFVHNMGWKFMQGKDLNFCRVFGWKKGARQLKVDKAP